MTNNRIKKAINIIVHMPSNKEAITKLQDINNNFYVDRIEKRLQESGLSLPQKQQLIDYLIEDYKGSNV